jgi:hypothetical protein
MSVYVLMYKVHPSRASNGVVAGVAKSITHANGYNRGFDDPYSQRKKEKPHQVVWTQYGMPFYFL